MKAKPNRYADSVCCICTGVACSARAMPENAGIYVSIENGPSMPSTASRTARAQRGARQSWSASGFTRRPSLLVRELRSLRDRKTGLRRGLESRQARRSRGRVVDPHKEAVTTRGAIASPGPKGWACKGAHALLRSRVKPSRLDPRPRLSLRPLADPTQARFSAARLLAPSQRSPPQPFAAPERTPLAFGLRQPIGHDAQYLRVRSHTQVTGRDFDAFRALGSFLDAAAP